MNKDEIIEGVKAICTPLPESRALCAKIVAELETRLDEGIPQGFSDEQRAILTLIRTVEHLLEAIDSLAVYPEGSFGFEDLAEAEKAARDVLAAIPNEMLDG